MSSGTVAAATELVSVVAAATTELTPTGTVAGSFVIETGGRSGATDVSLSSSDGAMLAEVFSSSVSLPCFPAGSPVSSAVSRDAAGLPPVMAAVPALLTGLLIPKMLLDASTSEECTAVSRAPSFGAELILLPFELFSSLSTVSSPEADFSAPNWGSLKGAVLSDKGNEELTPEDKRLPNKLGAPTPVDTTVEFEDGVDKMLPRAKLGAEVVFVVPALRAGWPSLVGPDVFMEGMLLPLGKLRPPN